MVGTAGYENSEYGEKKICMSVNETAMQIIQAIRDNELGVCVLSGVLASETSAQVPDGITGNNSHTLH